MPKPKAKAAQPLSNVVVAVRVRPQTARERSAGAQCTVSMHENSCVVVDPTGFSAAKAIENEGLVRATTAPPRTSTHTHPPPLLPPTLAGRS